MKTTNLLDSIIDEKLWLNEINQLVNEYDSLDNTLLENTSYDRDVQIVVRLDELGAFDAILRNERVKTPVKKARRAAAAAEKGKRFLSQQPAPERTPLQQAKRADWLKARQDREWSAAEVPTSDFGFGSDTRKDFDIDLMGFGKDGVRKLASMLVSAAKGGKDKLVSKIKAAINKVRGKKPDAPISDVPGIPKDVAAKADTTVAEPTANTPAEPATDVPSVEPEKTVAPDEVPPPAPSVSEPAPAKEPTQEPSAVQQRVNKNLQHMGITVEPTSEPAPAPVEPEKVEPATPAPAATITAPASAPAPEVPPAAEPTVSKKTKGAKTTPAPVPAKEPEKLSVPTASTTAPVTEPTPKPAEPEKVQPWSKTGREMRAQQLAKMSPKEKATEKEKSMKRMGFRPEPRKVGDRLKSAWKAFTAKPGDTVDIKQGYKSVFAEIKRLMEQYTQIESVLSEYALEEGVSNPIVEKLHARRNEIRSVLAEQIVREELYKHNVTLAELNPHQRTALMKTVQSRTDEMFARLSEMSHQEKPKSTEDASLPGDEGEEGDSTGFGEYDRTANMDEGKLN